MFALPGIILLITLVLVRPQELTPALVGVPLLHIALGIAVLGFALDVLADRAKVKLTPITGLALAFLGWNAFTVLIRYPGLTWTNIQRLLICSVLCLVIAHGTYSPKGLNAVAGAVLVCALWLAGVGIQQGLTPPQCIVIEDGEGNELPDVPTGRSCKEGDDCYRVGAIPGYRYRCESVGAFGITTIEDGRVRYIGTLHDPNELALTLGCALPIAFAMRREKKSSLLRNLLALATMVVMLTTIVLTGSRGGQLVVLAVFGTYFLVRSGIKGVFVAGLLAIPALIYGGRSGERAAGSTIDRLECWYQGADLTVQYPIRGVGHGMFEEYWPLTAHNAYLLAGAENGILGLLLFVAVVYAAGKISLTGVWRYKDPDDPRRAWSIGLLASVIGLALGVCFLSFTYHEVMWLFLGLSGAFYNVLRNADDGYEVKWRSRDYLAIAAIGIGMLGAFYGYTRYALG